MDSEHWRYKLLPRRVDADIDAFIDPMTEALRRAKSMQARCKSCGAYLGEQHMKTFRFDEKCKVCGGNIYGLTRQDIDGSMDESEWNGW